MRNLNQRYIGIRYALPVILVGLLISTAVTLKVQQLNENIINSALKRQADKQTERVVNRITLYQYGLRGMRGAIVTAGKHLNREVVVQYNRVRNVDEEFPGARGFGFIRRVPRAADADFIAAARADGWPDFTIRQLEPHDGERFVIQYIEPVSRNSEAVGLDIASEVSRRSAAIAAMRSGTAQLTGPITLVQATNKVHSGFLILLPIYRDLTAHTEEEREATCIGWSYAPLVMDEIINSLQIGDDQLLLTLSDVSDLSPVPFYDNAAQSKVRTSYRYSEHKLVFGRIWQLTFTPTPTFIRNLHLTQPRSVFWLGALLSALAAGFIGALIASAKHRKTSYAQQSRLAAIVKNSSDAIISNTLNGVVTSWNTGAEKLFGYPADTAIGQPLAKLIVPLELAHEEENILKRISQGETIIHFETRRRRRDGTELAVEVTASPIRDESGTIVGASKTLRDITTRQAYEKEILALNVKLGREAATTSADLHRTNRFFRDVLEAASEVSIIATDVTGTIMVFNTGAERMLGYSAAEMIGKQTPAIIHLASEVEARGAELSELYGEPIADFRVFVHKPEIEGSETREWTYVRKDGSHLTVSLSATAMRDDHGVITGYLGIAIDITQRKAAENQLSGALAFSQAVLNTAVNPIITIDSMGMIRSFNPAAEKTFGYTAVEAIGSSVSMLMPLTYAQEHDQHLERYRQDHSGRAIGISREISAQRANGSVFPVQISLGAMEVNGERLVVGIIADMTEYQRQRKALMEIRDQLTLAVETAELGVYSWDLNQDKLQMNDRMFALYQFPDEMRETGVSVREWGNRANPEDRESTTRKLQEAIRSNTSLFKTESRIVRPDGSHLYIQATLRIVRDASGKATRIVGINRDVTAQVERETMLREAKEQADAANKAKSAFLANMSHEIRTPMNAIMGMLQLVSHTELNTRQHDYIDKASSAARTLLGLLNDILDFSKIEAGKLDLEQHPFSMEQLLRDLAIVLAGTQGNKPVEVIYDLDTDLPSLLMGDNSRLRQILVNLAGNALKFTDKGYVVIKVAKVDRRDNHIRLRFSIMDSGIGISPERQRMIFESFSQADSSINRRFGGTGLGLAISQHLVHLMGGEIHVDSALGRGSHFWFDLDLPIASNTPQRQLAPSTLRVLIVDDSQLFGDILMRAAVSFGWHAHYVSSGIQSIEELCAARDRGEPYRVVFMDWHMPDMDGLVAAQTIRERMGNNSPTIIMVTAYGRETLTAEQLRGQAPFADFLSKPVTPRELDEAVQRSLSGSPTQRDTRPKAKDLRLRGMHFLVAEDNNLNRQIAVELLMREGAHVSVAVDGAEAVEKVLSANPLFDAVIMDLQMPVVDGLEATRRIRRDGRFNELPILAMTANASKADRLQCLEAGMNDHIGKPIDIEELVAVLLRLTGHDTTDISTNTSNEANTSTDEQLIQSLPKILQRFGGNLELLRATLPRFESDTQHLLGEIENLQPENVSALTANLHSLKGTASTIGAVALSAHAAALEQKIKTKALEIADAGALRTLSHELRELLAESYAKLLESIGSDQPPTKQIDDAELSPGQWRAKLEEILPLLEAHDMQALDLVEALPTPTDERLEHYREFYAHVQELDFDLAFSTLRNWIKNL